MKTSRRPIKKSISPQSGGPTHRRKTDLDHQLVGDACKEAISFVVHSPNEKQIYQKMKEVFQYHQELVYSPDRSTDVLIVLPRFLDVKGLANQDFLLMFDDETSSKLLEKWDTVLKPKVIQLAKSLITTTDLRHLLKSAEKRTENDIETNWDNYMSSLLLLLHLLPPPAGGKRTKISASDAVGRLVHFHKSFCSIEDHLDRSHGRQPYLHAVGRRRSKIDNYYIVVDKRLVPCQATSGLCAFDELFKAHFVFNLTYDDTLVNFYTFVQTTIYNIDVGKTREAPSMIELRTKRLN
ncbi:uncharacterized protein LOC123482288 [Coregonus clupeaformis]|uniref:uncharacterized protein LOC123482288 n=1 Tax=Coregonus clupeaformis TaxID=59861 RepID=UPI001E1C92F1|nr:uncharacterized protein LOC123482288 [Coregonus clupeaformis]